MRPIAPLPLRSVLAHTLALFCGLTLRADDQVLVTANARPAYTQQKFGDAKPRTETYVVMQGTFFPGIRVDHGLEKMPFRKIAETIAAELSRQNYLPAVTPKDADLLVVVHWGVTKPSVSNQELAAGSSSSSDTGSLLADNAQRMITESNLNSTFGGAPSASDPGDSSPYATNQLPHDDMRQLDTDRLDQLADGINNDLTSASNAQLLGYGRDLRRLAQSSFETEESRALQSDLTTERYFIILKAYDLREKTPPGRSRRAVWTLHLNMRSPGINFQTALGRMSQVSGQFAGRTTDRVTSVVPKLREARVELGPLTIIRDSK